MQQQQSLREQIQSLFENFVHNALVCGNEHPKKSRNSLQRNNIGVGFDLV